MACRRWDSHRRQSSTRRRPADRLRFLPERRRSAGRKWYPMKWRLAAGCDRRQGGDWLAAGRAVAGKEGGRTATIREKKAGQPEVAHGKEEANRPEMVSDKEEVGRLPEVVPGKKKADGPIGTGKGGRRVAKADVETTEAVWRPWRIAMVLCLLLSAVSLVSK